ncbi:hypothetical protein, partial [Synechococcus sp. BA-132 BA5]|uniref:hypothetical protein n=1 Tax=Synechococcus sp. BA-132 BA5 TaxID=3110252 RepID=UPI002B1FC245
FYIVRFEDTNGNFITYNYEKPYDKALCISEINFSANINGLNAPLNKIKFNYDYAKRGENAYIMGLKHEKIELLKSVFVYTGNLIFRKYILTHDLDPELSYERVVNIQEFNSNNEGANPVIFEYPNTEMNIAESETVTTYNNNLEFEDIRVSGDFDGDGKLDFMANNSLYTKLFQNTAGGTVYSSNEIFNRAFATNLIFNGKVDQFNSIANPLLENDILKLRFFSLINNQFQLRYENSYPINNLIDCQVLCPTIDCSTLPAEKNFTHQYFEGDFNGDGKSQVLLLMHDVVKETEWVYIDDPSDPHLSPDPIGPDDPNQPFVPFYECRVKTNISLLPNNFKILNIEQNSSDINVVNAQNSLPQDKNFY